MPCLPPEMYDYIFDFLHDDTEALKQGCLVSKLWIPPTRRHLFNHVSFRNADHLSAWKKCFPPDLDPVQSPACYTRSLYFRCAELVTDADSNWIGAFTKVVRLGVRINPNRGRPNTSLAPFHNLSSTVKFLKLGWNIIRSRVVFDFIRSFPLLGELHVGGSGCLYDDGVISPSSSLPVLTGTLVLEPTVADFVRRLLKLPNSDLRFRKIVWKVGSRDEEFEPVRDLVERCSNTLEYLDISYCGTSGKPTPFAPSRQVKHLIASPFSGDRIDLSSTKELKEVVFRHAILHPAEVASTLDTITSNHESFRLASLHLPSHYIVPCFLGPKTAAEEMGPKLLVLDCALARLRKLRPNCVKAIFEVNEGWGKVEHKWIKNHFNRYLPNLMMMEEDLGPILHL